MTPDRFEELVSRYLDSVRNGGLRGTLTPFTHTALAFVHAVERGRPGYCLQALHGLFDAAARQAVHVIDKDFAIRNSGDATSGTQS